MPKQPGRVFSREFKEAAARRVLAGENVQRLAQELGVWRKSLYDWRDRYERGGADALLAPGRPRKAAADAERVAGVRDRRGETTPADRIAKLERKVGQQALELDFFARALRHVKASAPPSDGRGAGASSP